MTAQNAWRSRRVSQHYDLRGFVIGRFGASRIEKARRDEMQREIRSQAQLRDICLQTLKGCEGFEDVDEILIQPRDPHAGGANWTLAGFRPRVANNALRAARTTIQELQMAYQLDGTEPSIGNERKIF